MAEVVVAIVGAMVALMAEVVVAVIDAVVALLGAVLAILLLPAMCSAQTEVAS